MKDDSEETIIQRIQPHCDALPKALKHQKENMHMTNQEVADITGLPLSNIAKLFSGSLSTPCIFNVAAVCICLHQSMDALFDNHPDGKNAEQADKIAQLEAELKDMEYELKLMHKVDSMNEDTIKRLDTRLKDRKQIIFCLSVLSGFMAIALVSYLWIDINNRDIGFVRHTWTPMAILVAVVIILVAYIAFINILQFIKKMKKEDDK